MFDAYLHIDGIAHKLAHEVNDPFDEAWTTPVARIDAGIRGVGQDVVVVPVMVDKQPVPMLVVTSRIRTFAPYLVEKPQPNMVVLTPGESPVAFGGRRSRPEED